MKREYEEVSDVKWVQKREYWIRKKIVILNDNALAFSTSSLYTFFFIVIPLIIFFSALNPFFLSIPYQTLSSSSPQHISAPFPSDLSSSSTSVDVVDAVSHRLQTTPPSSSRHTTTATTTTTSSTIDPSRVTVSGPGVRLVSVSSQAEFTVSTPQHIRQEEVNVKITGMYIWCVSVSALFFLHSLPFLFSSCVYGVVYCQFFRKLIISSSSLCSLFLLNVAILPILIHQ